MNGYQIGVPYMTPTVKKLIIINLVIWFVGIIILQGYMLSEPLIGRWFGLSTVRVLFDFWIWQVGTYMFLHTESVMHVLFNMLMIWFIGAELEGFWGRRFFLGYYLGCGVGAALIWMLGSFGYYLVTSNHVPMATPVLGASGAVFGLLLAYGLLFGHRIIYFFGVFPMQARFFVMILGGIEVMNLLSQGLGSGVATLAHLGGLISGYLILKFFPRIRDIWVRRQTGARGRRLKLVVDNEDLGSKKGPRYWN